MVGNRCPVTKKKNQMLSMTSIMLADKNIKEIFINILTDDKKVGNQYGCYSRQTHFKTNKFKNQIKIDKNNTDI